ncbi:MAG TPA: DNA-3-methyladenine glycosylase [Thermoanaerobaculia bacterium]|nr:DNA-3-methyladenine glycosylase [Thermoanaerobaculia bacterium]
MIPAPDRRLHFDPDRFGLRPAPRDFFRRDTVRVARDLIGAWFARRYRGSWYGGRIVETEAYVGPADAAAHSWKGRRTKRVESMYADGGTLYVFFVYGMHHCANVVTRSPGDPQAVLLRAAEGPEGAPARLLAGPARLCAAMGITKSASGLDLVEGGTYRVFLPRKRRRKIGVSARIGVDYAGEAAGWPLRFFDESSEAVSVRAPRPISRLSSGSRRLSRGAGRSS